jgi:hypothetical protein
VQIWSVVPLFDGFAPIGLTEKYASVATVASVEHTPGKAVVTLHDSGTFAAWCETRPKAIKLNGAPVSEQVVEWSGNVVRVKIVGLTDGRPRPQMEFNW